MNIKKMNINIFNKIKIKMILLKIHKDGLLENNFYYHNNVIIKNY